MCHRKHRSADDTRLIKESFFEYNRLHTYMNHRAVIRFHFFKEYIFSLHNSAAYNDVKVAALGEAVQGAGKDYPIVYYVTISTGVGNFNVVVHVSRFMKMIFDIFRYRKTDQFWKICRNYDFPD